MEKELKETYELEFEESNGAELDTESAVVYENMMIKRDKDTNQIIIYFIKDLETSPVVVESLFVMDVPTAAMISKNLHDLIIRMTGGVH